MTSKKTIFLLFSLLAGQLLQAQEAGTNRKLQFGFRVSPNLTWTKIKSGQIENKGSGLGFSYGITADYNFNTNYYLNIEALVTSMRNKIGIKDSVYQGSNGVGSYYTNVEQDYKFQYLQIPVSLKMKTNFINGMRYFFQAGIAPSILIFRNVRVSANPTLPDQEEWFSPNASDTDKGDFQVDPNNTGSKAFTNNIGLFRVPLVLGAGIEYKLSGNTAFTAGLRWDNGFTDIFRDKNVVGINNYLGLSLGVLF